MIATPIFQTYFVFWFSHHELYTIMLHHDANKFYYFLPFEWKVFHFKNLSFEMTFCLYFCIGSPLTWLCFLFSLDLHTIDQELADLAPAELESLLVRFLFSATGTRYRYIFDVDSPISCGKPLPEIKVWNTEKQLHDVL